MFNLQDPTMLKRISNKVLIDIDKFCVEKYDGGFRDHLGASLIGKKCKRYLYLSFRWCFKDKCDGRQLRLYNRGHREEERFIEWLEGIGCEVSDGDYIDELTYKQHRISDCKGHFGGSMDGIGYLPKEYGIPNKILYEFKTNGTGAGFTNVKANGMAVSKQVHYAQICTYGYKAGFEYCLYLIINKNDDNLTPELVKLDHALGKAMIEKANDIIFAETIPDKFSENPSHFECKYCNAKEHCHGEKQLEMNCRSCKNSFPVDNAEWYCHLYKSNIPKEYIKTGCPNWIGIL